MSDRQRSEWVLAIVNVIFDLDVGQKIEQIYPPGGLTDDEASDVAFHSFPDSMSMELYSKSSVRDSTFFFRIRRRNVPVVPVPHGSNGGAKDYDDTRHYDQSPYLYGFVFCRQRQDERLRRGGEQKSVVVVSEYPYSSVLSQLSQYVGPLYFNQGTQGLAEVYEDVLEWPLPSADMAAVLAVGEVTMMARAPASFTLPPPAPPDQLDNTGRLPLTHVPAATFDETQPIVQGVFFEVDVFTPLRMQLGKAWMLWEMVVLAEPLMIIAPTPGLASQAVAALISLISPLPYSADFRPYFTIHDIDFKALASGQLPCNSNALPRLLGITNLYFLKALPLWPNVMSTGKRPAQQLTNGNMAGMPPAAASRLRRLHPGNAVKAVQRARAGAHILLTEDVESLWLSYRPLTRADHGLLGRLLQSKASDSLDKAASIAAANTSALRRHFNELTLAFLSPFADYFSPQLPPASAEALQEGAPHLPAFSHTDFLESLQRAALPAVLVERFSSQAGCIAFYKRFLESPNFSSWFERRRQAAWAWQEEAWEAAKVAQELAAEAAREEAERAEEVQLVGTFFELEQRLESATSSKGSQDSLAELKQELKRVFEAMPRDLQQTMLSAPRRATMLHSLHVQSKVRIPGQPQRAPPLLSPSPAAELQVPQ